MFPHAKACHRWQCLESSLHTEIARLQARTELLRITALLDVLPFFLGPLHRECPRLEPPTGAECLVLKKLHLNAVMRAVIAQLAEPARMIAFNGELEERSPPCARYLRYWKS